jgi:fucose permease
VASVYLAGFLQGLTLVSYPASGAVLKGALGLSDAEYGAIFLPQVSLAVVGALGGAALARRVGLKPLLVLALLANALSQAALAGAAGMPSALTFPLVLAGTGALGLGFGLGGAPLNGYPPAFFPRRHHSAVVALHTALGVGLMLGPLAVGALAGAGWWQAFPLASGALCVLLALGVRLSKLPEHAASTQASAAMARGPARTRAFWLFATIAVLYAFAEGTFSNWVVVYLTEDRQLDGPVATSALSAFWGALVAGRLLVSVVVARLPAEWAWISLPALMAAVFLVLPAASTPALAVALFALAGLACSAFFPLTITLASSRFPAHAAWVASMLIAALMIGVGLGSFAIGALRALLPLENLYPLSAAYPLLALLLALGALRVGSRRLATVPPS